MLVVQLFGRDCVVIAVLRVAPIRSRTASVALIAFFGFTFNANVGSCCCSSVFLILFASSIP